MTIEHFDSARWMDYRAHVADFRQCSCSLTSPGKDCDKGLVLRRLALRQQDPTHAPVILGLMRR